MPRICFVEKNFHAKSLRLIEQANAIIEEYAAQGFRLTLRQLYYQFVARALIPNRQAEYDKLGATISDARLAGLIDWDALEDRTRYLRKPPSWSDPNAILKAAADGYREDIWRTQNVRVEVWVEKDALVGIIEPACEELRLPFFACRGYTSQSAQYEAGMRFRRHLANGQRVVVLHLGDHDPSGIDMTRDNEERARMFSRAFGRQFKLMRLALNYDQVEEYNPPPNPAKVTDSRFASYEAEHGVESWELDALEPTIIDGLIRDAVNEIVDQDRYDEALAEEAANRERLAKHGANFDWLNPR